MFKFTHAFLLLEMLVATALGSDLSFAGIQPSQVDLKSDVKALQDLVQDLRTRLEEQIEKSPSSQNVQSSKSPTCQDTRVAFFAGLSQNIGPFNQHTDLVFGSVVTNDGSSYSASTGRFTAPFSATYQFSVALSAQHTKAAAVSVLKNGVVVMTILTDSKPVWATSSNVAILSLKAGDQVWVRLHPDVNSYAHGYMFTTFSGFLIFKN